MSETGRFEDSRKLFREDAVNKMKEYDELGEEPKFVYPRRFTMLGIVALLVLGAAAFIYASIANGVYPIGLMMR